MNRFKGNGEYILDEKESSHSPLRQLSMFPRTDELVQQGSQFIIPIHSPIIMIDPDAKMFQFTEAVVVDTTLEETEHYRFMKQFFENREGIFNS